MAFLCLSEMANFESRGNYSNKEDAGIYSVCNSLSFMEQLGALSHVCIEYPLPLALPVISSYIYIAPWADDSLQS